MGRGLPRGDECRLDIVVVGGGAAGFFGAITCAETFPQHKVFLLEKTRQPLAKVRISGGGRCNATHACFDPALLIQNYPRGGKELRGAFARFQPKDTIQWFERRGVELKVEEDGRMFPISDSSESIIRCLQQAATRANVQIRLEVGVESFEKIAERFHLKLTNGEALFCDRLLIASGSQTKIYPLLQGVGHSIETLVPSLFTFNIPDSSLLDLAGIALNASLKLPQIGLEQIGPLLLTHWGFSGPAVLKLSAWGARELHRLDYKTELNINWVPSCTEEALRHYLIEMKTVQGAKLVASDSILGLPKQLWKRLVEISLGNLEIKWAALSKKHLHDLIHILRKSHFNISGKTTYKQEFVTCGGVKLDEVDFKTMQSKKVPGLYFAGEVLNIDGVTGGFNFQNAWTTGWIAGQAIGI